MSSRKSIRVRGAFDVTTAQAAPEDAAEGITLGRRSLEKKYHGDFDATAKGEMLTAGTSVKGSAAYAAVERVTGMLGGQKGSFALVHRGVMSDGRHELSITVVPNSGNGELAGIEGTLGIEIVDGKHFYDFEYSLPEK